jgi:L-asparaginase/Glu-tRNA(Gln) amidotransferase subunit D
MTRNTDTKALRDRISALELKRRDAAPNARGIYTTKIRQAQKQLQALGESITDEHIEQTAAAPERADYGKREAKPDPKPAAKKASRKAARTVTVSGMGGTRKFKVDEAATAAKPSVWQERMDVAIEALRTGTDAAQVTECPTPKTATGTADKLRKLIAAGRVDTRGVSVAVKSHGPYVEARIA